MQSSDRPCPRIALIALKELHASVEIKLRKIALPEMLRKIPSMIGKTREPDDFESWDFQSLNIQDFHPQSSE